MKVTIEFDYFPPEELEGPLDQPDRFSAFFVDWVDSSFNIRNLTIRTQIGDKIDLQQWNTNPT